MIVDVHFFLISFLQYYCTFKALQSSFLSYNLEEEGVYRGNVCGFVVLGRTTKVYPAKYSYS